MKCIGLTLFALIFSVSSIYATDHSLGQQQAEQRFAAIKNIHYNLNIKLGATKPDFSGKVDIAFLRVANQQPLRIDFTNGQIDALSINGKPFKRFTYNKYFIMIPADALSKGQQNIQITYKHAYDKSGSGVYRYLDSKDQRTYIYTVFEPVAAAKAFPCFDQPDLKARFTLKLTTPKSWLAVSAAKINKTISINKSVKQSIFKDSTLMSTYAFSFDAGPFKVWHSHYKNIPLRLMARQSIAKQVDSSRWFKVTKFGLKYYNHYFHYPYPYAKYDQLIVPNLGGGALENIAAVLFHESFASKNKAQKFNLRLSDTIYHEMAHMWFGDLVTMKWWDGLWLNESFATYMSVLAMQESPWLHNVDVYYFNVIKAVALAADRKKTTHPIMGSVKYASQAMAQFDDITYNKGCSVLQQLAFYIAAHNFQKGVQDYIAKYSHANATTEDFFNALTAALPKSRQANMAQFYRLWFDTTGTNTVRINKSVLQQGNSPLRPHAIQLGFFNKAKQGRLKVSSSQKLYYESNKASFKAPSVSNQFVMPNVTDQDFVNLDFSKSDWNFIRNNVSRFEKPLIRAMLWRSLWDQVYYSKMPAPVFLKTMTRNLGLETEPSLLAKLQKFAMQALQYLPSATLKQQRYRDAYIEQMHKLAWQQLEAVKPKSALQKSWFKFYLFFARSKADLQQLNNILMGKVKLSGLKINQKLRWKIIVQLNEYQYEAAKKLLAAEIKADSSVAGNKMAFIAEIVQPNLKQKNRWLNKIIADEGSMSMRDMKLLTHHLFPSSQARLRFQAAPQLFAAIKVINDSKAGFFLSSFTRHMSPVICDEKSLKQFKVFMASDNSFKPMVKKALENSYDTQLRCVANKKVAASWMFKN